MVGYVCDLARDIDQWFREGARAKDVKGAFVVLAEELDRLDPRDFVPSSQFKFVNLRRQVRAAAQYDKPDNSCWKWLSENTESNVELAEDVIRRVVFPLSEISEFPGNPHAIIADAWNSEAARIAGRAWGGQRLIKQVFEHIRSLLRELVEALNGWGHNFQTVKRSFAWMANDELRKIVMREGRGSARSAEPGFLGLRGRNS